MVHVRVGTSGSNRVKEEIINFPCEEGLLLAFNNANLKYRVTQKNGNF